MTTVEQRKIAYDKAVKRSRIIWGSYFALVVGTFIPGWFFMISGYGMVWAVASALCIMVPVVLNSTPQGYSKADKAKLELLNAEYDEIMNNTLNIPFPGAK